MIKRTDTQAVAFAEKFQHIVEKTMNSSLPDRTGGRDGNLRRKQPAFLLNGFKHILFMESRFPDKAFTINHNHYIITGKESTMKKDFQR